MQTLREEEIKNLVYVYMFMCLCVYIRVSTRMYVYMYVHICMSETILKSDYSAAIYLFCCCFALRTVCHLVRSHQVGQVAWPENSKVLSACLFGVTSAYYHGSPFILHWLRDPAQAILITNETLNWWALATDLRSFS